MIIAYIGKKGCVMASDKRKIAYFGNKDNLAQLEDELYAGKITSEEELTNRAQELDIQIKLSSDGNKISTIDDVVRGEVSSKGAFETKRKRIYGTTNGYQIIELIGSNITSKNSGEKAIIIFGNKYAKAEAEKLISKKWKSSLSLKYMGDIFAEIIKEISKSTPTVGGEVDVLLKQPQYTPQEAQKHLDEIIETDVKLLSKFRQKLQNDLIEKSREIELASKIIDEGSVGKVINVDGKMLEVKLNDKTVAYDGNWKELAGPNENVIMFTESDDVKVGDEVVIEGEDLCLKKDKSSLKCNIILCNA
ncbi:MAG: DUF2121 domain-containing protein [Methanobrevibacter sp.]|nr:DUF2121 domain-containing protein [Methanobrevibacter sp.]MDO5848716.1 DUF2121 domain-containing protein [Methanobrevibacter sp.]